MCQLGLLNFLALRDWDLRTGRDYLDEAGRRRPNGESRLAELTNMIVLASFSVSGEKMPAAHVAHSPLHYDLYRSREFRKLLILWRALRDSNSRPSDS